MFGLKTKLDQYRMIASQERLDGNSFVGTQRVHGLCGLTFELSGRRRCGPAKRNMNLGASTGHAGGGPLERRVRRHCVDGTEFWLRLTSFDGKPSADDIKDSASVEEDLVVRKFPDSGQSMRLLT